MMNFKLFLPLLSALLLCAGVSADEVQVSTGDGGFYLTFPEPVVSLSVTEQAETTDAEAEGRRMLNITGEGAEQISARWEDQDTLLLIPAEGTRAGTVYHLSLKPGTTYLSGREVQAEIPDLCVPDVALRVLHEVLLPQGSGIILAATEGGRIRPHAPLTPELSLPFEFREASRLSGKPFEGPMGRVVRAHAEPVFLKHGMSILLLNHLVQHMVEMSKLDEDTPLPGCILVVPDEPLTPEHAWALGCEGGQGYAENSCLTTVEGDPHLETALTQKRVDDSPTDSLLNITFNAPVRRADLPALFRAMQLKAGGSSVSPTTELKDSAGDAEEKDGVLSRRLTYMGKTLVFSFDPTRREQKEALPAVTDTEQGDDVAWRYDNPTLTQEMTIRVRSAEPCTVELVLPKGALRSSLGLDLGEDKRYRVTLSVLRPMVDMQDVVRYRYHVELPRDGERCLNLRTESCARVDVSTYRWTPEQAVRQMPLFADLMNKDLVPFVIPDRSPYEQALQHARFQAGLEERDADPTEKTSAQKAREQHHRVLSKLLKSGEKLDTRSLPIDADGRYISATLPLSLDELTGGASAPGIYVLHLRLRPTPQVIAAAQAVGLTEADVTEEKAIIVNVTGLCATGDQGTVYAHRLADGRAPEKGCLYRCGKCYELNQGMATVELTGRNDKVNPLMMLTAEDDILLLADFYRSVHKETPRRCVSLLSDRELYRPGETVHLFGLQRRVDGAHSRTLTEPLELTVYGPDNKKLHTSRVQPDTYGAFDLSYELPKGEEDVAGAYRFRLGPVGAMRGILAFCMVRSEVFRRDSFSVEMKAEMQPVCPDSYRCTVRAQDYNGSPLQGAKVELELSSNLLLDAQTETGTLKKELTTGEDGSAVFEYRLRPALLKEGEEKDTSLVYVQAEASVTNDREEVRRCSAFSRGAMAEFRLVRFGQHLRLIRITGDNSEPALDVAQNLHGVLTAVRRKRTPLPNGFVRLEPETVTLWEGEMHFPADDSVGQLFPYSFKQDKEEWGEMKVRWTGRDAAGHEVAQTEHLYPWLLQREKQTTPTLRLREQDGALIASSSAAGSARVVVQNPEKTAIFSVSVEEGEHSLRLPEGAVPAGPSQVTLVLPHRGEDGLFSAVGAVSCSCFRPDVERALTLTAELSADSVEPGAELTLRGQVRRTADGSPEKARVLLFAVDEGMLSVSGQEKRLPNWEREFSLLSSIGRHSDFFGGRDNSLVGFAMHSQEWQGLWQGERHLRDKWMMKFPMGITLALGCGLDAGEERSNGIRMMKAAAPAMAKARSKRVWENEGGGMGGVDAVQSLNEEEAAGDMAPATPCMASEEVAPEPTVRQNFTPLALWTATTESDAEGHFECRFRVPDTLTRYRLFCVAADEEGNRFGNHETSFEVRQAVMLTPGTPFFMSTGDRQLLPLTITNATDKEDTWQVQLSTGETQSIRLGAKRTGTLFFKVAPQEEGELTLRWTARAAAGCDAVEGSFPVRFPAPLLKEHHHLALAPKGEDTQAQLIPAALLAPELADSVRGELSIELSANPLLHLAGVADFVLAYPYCGTEPCATGLLPWLMYDRLAPFCPQMAETPASEVRKHISSTIEKLFKRQGQDGGLSYWEGGRESCFWASAHAALILTYAAEQGYEVPQDKVEKLHDYLRTEKEKAVQQQRYREWGPLTRYQVARSLGDKSEMLTALHDALKATEAQQNAPRPFSCCLTPRLAADARLLLAVHHTEGATTRDFLTWLRCRARDSRHPSSWSSGWALMALREYIGTLPKGSQSATVETADGRTIELGNGITRLTLAGRGQKLGEVKDIFTAKQGTIYVNLIAKAQPERTEYPGVTEKGLQITRLYEKKDAEGKWQPATDFAVGDVVRITLTCAKVAPDLEYLVLEDYLPSCMEAVNPAIRSQAAGIDFVPWSAAFDNKEYLADRVRGFCTRWGNRQLLNMVYFARVKRAGTCTAPPAQAQLLYEPQTHGLSPNAAIEVSSADEGKARNDK